MKYKFEYRFCGESTVKYSKEYDSISDMLNAQREFIKKNKNKLDYCKICY